MRKNFNYVFSSEINVPLRIRLVSLSGYLTSHGDIQRYATPSGCMFVRLTIYCNGRMVGRSVQSSFPHQPIGSSIRNIQEFDEWIFLPVTYSDLNRDALLHVTLWDVGTCVEPVLIAQCTKKLFSKHSIFRSGIIDLKLEQVIGKSDKNKALTTNNNNLDFINFSSPVKQAESCEDAEDSTPLLKTDENINSLKSSNKYGIQLKDLLKKEKLYNQKFIDRVDWLDKITFAKLEEIKQEAKSDDRSLFLTIEFPIFKDSDDLVYSVIFFAGEQPSNNNDQSQQSEDDLLDVDPLLPRTRTERQADPELDMENLSEIKHHMMTRNARAMDIDRRLQPNPIIRDTLEAIIKSSSCQSMLMEERDLIWKFRFWLKSNPKALTKFVRSVNWHEKLEVRQAIQVILEWEPIDACDALELLSPNFSHPFVRRYAVSRLQSTTTANILLFLPQLVQALRYEPSQEDLAASVEEDLLVVTQNENTIGVVTSTIATTSTSVHPKMASSRQSTTSDIPVDYFEGHESMDLATFLIKIACQNSPIAIFLYWYLKVEVEANSMNKQISEFYSSVIAKFQQALSNGNSASRHTLTTISSQKKFVDTLVDIAKTVADSSGSRSKKLELLKKKLVENNDLIDLKGMSLPLDPSVHVKSIQPESTILFSSNLMPMRLTFSTVRGSAPPYECAEAYTTIFKRGDDLRQDQLVLQMIRLIDSLLKEDKLDLCLTPYAVLATSCSEGFVQFVRGATPLADIKSIQDTLRTFRPSSSAPYGIEADVLNNYVKSCAGYSIICYILGIGDRHLHNLLLCENGKMFHVDFGFILGRDPKPMPPPMKLTSEMINAMGGQNSEHFRAFVNYCTIAFCILRRHANLITNLFSLMLDAGIPDISIERDKAVMKVLERFHLQLSDEAVCQLVVRLIESSLSAKMPLIVDFVHNVRQYMSN